MSRRSTALALVILSLSIPACRGTAPAHLPATAPPPPPPPPAQAPAKVEPLEIKWVRTAAEYEALVRQAYAVAQAQVEKEATGRAPGTWGVVLDADETVISNLTHQVERAGQPYDETAWAAWVRRKEARALPGAAEFLNRVRALGGKIAIVTNRRQAVCADTAAVFEAERLVYDAMLCRTDGSDKNPRFQAVERGLPPSTLPPMAIVAFVGDNIQDFPWLSQAARGQGAQAFGEFGKRFFIIPNPMYGSWER
jgi:5'-nucleotidase (lipoprotein e(P4) family)